MKPQFPFKGSYIGTQTYDANPKDSNGKPIYAEGRHGGLDIVPTDDKGRKYPADIYPVFSGVTLSVSNTDPKRGKGIKVRSELDRPLIAYLKANGVVPKSYTGRVWLDVLDWHCLEVTDLDGFVDQNTPIAKAGNTGWVFSDGSPVPDHLKGVPPYPGLHDHHVHILVGEQGTLNLDKDPYGRINPTIIHNYKGAPMNQAKVVKSKNSNTVWVCYPMPTEDYLASKAALEGFEIPPADNFPDTDSLF